MASHECVELRRTSVSCSCGWCYRLDEPGDPARDRDHLLDSYNMHRTQGFKGG